MKFLAGVDTRALVSIIPGGGFIFLNGGDRGGYREIIGFGIRTNRGFSGKNSLETAPPGEM